MQYNDLRGADGWRGIPDPAIGGDMPATATPQNILEVGTGFWASKTLLSAHYVSDFTWGRIFRSADGGTTWVRMTTNGLGSDRVWTLGVDPNEPDRLLAASSAGGLHLLVSASTEARGAQQDNSKRMEDKDESRRSF